MENCNGCGRPLNQDEYDLCPACQSSKSNKKKKWTGTIGGIIAVCGLIVFKILTGGKNNEA